MTPDRPDFTFYCTTHRDQHNLVRFLQDLALSSLEMRRRNTETARYAQAVSHADYADRAERANARLRGDRASEAREYTPTPDCLPDGSLAPRRGIP